jgi:twitching motility protein PilJ
MALSFKTIGTTNTWLYAMIGLLLLLFVSMVATFTIVAIKNQGDEAYLNKVTQLRLLSQQITQYAAAAARGDDTGFKQLIKSRIEYKKILELLANGDHATGIPVTPPVAENAINSLTTVWQEVEISVGQLLDTQEAVTKLYADFTEIEGVMTDVEAQTENMTNTMTTAGATPVQMYLATHQLVLLERITNGIRASFTRGYSADAVDAEGQLDEAISQFGDTLTSLQEGNEESTPKVTAVTNPTVVQAIQGVSSLFNERIGRIDYFLDKAEQLFLAKDAWQAISAKVPNLLDNVEKLQVAYNKATKERLVSPTLGNLLAILVFVLLLTLGYVIIRSNQLRATEARERLSENQRMNQRNQEAILRLLSEISDLADGDLTVNATVTEDFTGAIADAINFSIEALRDLIININKTAIQVTAAAQKTRAVAGTLIQANEKQTQQIAKAGQAIIGMANSVKKVSSNAVESAEVAKRSVELSRRGAKAVQDTIGGMDSMREQVQETAKRIKRLGESAQEIGEIVGLIDDIADQTNILALNAAIQAAMAGEAGRGFAVVADEIQRLAERSGNATKQIDAIVKTIQGDTNEAVNSMEQSTTGVVSGAKIAERAGEALTEIERVSVQLAGQIENISQTARTQAAVAANIAGTMNIIQDIATQALSGTTETAASIERLAKLANDLKTSAAGFKLPPEVQKAIEELAESLTTGN